MEPVLRAVLPAIKPSKEQAEAEARFSQAILKRIRSRVPPGCEVVLVGSMAKGTFLQDRKEVDVFVLFDRSVPKESLERSVKNIMKVAFPGLGYQVSYAEHPYVRFRLDGHRIDLVPAYKISNASERISAVDRSVLHTDFVLKHLKGKRIDGVLFLKAFLKANSLYGAEIKIQGFSGYLCELLIIHYGCFPKLMKEAAKWRRPVFIDIKKYHKNLRSAIEQFDSPLIIIDPTDKNRNVAAAVSNESFKKFISLCKRFIKKPSKDYFLRKPETFEQKAARIGSGANLFILTLPRPDVVDDVLWGQINRMLGQLKEHMEEFKPKEFIADDKEHIVRLAIILEKDLLSSEMLIEGPPLEMKKHIESFKKSHKKAKFLIRKKRVYAVVKRPAQKAKAENAIMDFFRSFQKTKSHLACAEELIVLERKD